jgi:outer membrane receptor protein involved in Fe transport
LVYSKYSFLSKDYNSISEAYSQSYSLEHTESKLIFNYLLSNKHKLNFGIGGILYNLDRGEIKPAGEQSQRKYSYLGVEKALENTIFAEDTYTLSDKIKITGGIRYSFYNKFGPDTINIYADGVEKRVDNIIDQEIIGKGDKVINYSKPEFRFLFDYKTSPFGSLKLAYNEMSQNIFLLSNSFSITPTDQWKLADYYIKPGFSRLASLGYSQFLVSMGITASIEGYYKKEDNVLEFKDGADFIKTKEVETMTLQGQQDAYGIEFMVSKDEGRLNGWLSYTFSRSFVRVNGENRWDKINKGEAYASNYDKPNVLNIVANYNLNRRFTVSATVAYSTGRPVTLPQAKYYIEGTPYVEYSARNEYRIPDYFRLDLALTIEGNLKKKKLFHSYWMMSVYNLTGRNNPYNIYFQSNDGLILGYKYSIIGVPVFTVSWNFKLGNYEAK